MTAAPTYQMASYPKKLTLRDGRDVVIKPMLPGDREALLAFFRQIPGDDRYYLKEDVTSPEVIERWAAALDYHRAFKAPNWA